jgi:hypothetical protein
MNVDLKLKSKGTFKDGISLQNLLFDPRMFSGNCRQVLEDQLRALRLSGSGLARDDDALVLALPHHEGVAVVADGEDVRRKLPDLLVPVQLDLLGGVDGKNLVRVYCNLPKNKGVMVSTLF